MALHAQAREDKALEFGFKLDGKWFQSIDEASVYFINELFSNNSTLSQTELAQKINEIQVKIYQVLHTRYHGAVKFEQHDSTPLDALYLASQQPLSSQPQKKGDKTKNSSTINGEIKLWGRGFDAEFEGIFYDIAAYMIDDSTTDIKKREKDWNNLVAGIKNIIINERSNTQKLTKEEFLEKLLVTCKEHMKLEDSDIYLDIIKSRLSYSIGTNSPDTRVASIKDGIRELVARSLLDASSSPGEKQVDFYKKVNDVVTARLKKVPFDLSSVLLNFNAHPIPKDEIRQ
ncbi:MAG: hypothetical protein PSV35_07090, partial [bacterium]|nr:hypothetical protein [bacterium]